MTIIDNKLSTPTIATDAMGVEVSWAFGTFDSEAVVLPRGLVSQVLVDNGFSAAYLGEVAPSDALKKAAKLAPSTKRVSIKELAKPNSDSPRVYGVYTRTAEQGEAGDKWTMGARVRAVGDEVVALPPEGAPSMAGVAADIATNMERQANSLLANVFNRDISLALIAMGTDLGWISRRRNSGGMYYMQSDERAERFVAVLHALAALTAGAHISNRFLPEVMEVFPRPLSQATIAGAASHHFETKIGDLVSQLRKAADTGKMRESTMDKRVAEIDALMVQAEEYRAILDEGATELKARLADTRKLFLGGIAEGCDALGKEFAAFDKIAPPAPTKDAPAPAKAAPAPEAAPAPAPTTEADPFDFLDA